MVKITYSPNTHPPPRLNNKSSNDKGQVVSQEQAVPEGTQDEGHHRALEGYTRVAHMTQPVCSLDVPVVKDDLQAGGCLGNIWGTFGEHLGNIWGTFGQNKKSCLATFT